MGCSWHHLLPPPATASAGHVIRHKRRSQRESLDGREEPQTEHQWTMRFHAHVFGERNETWAKPSLKDQSFSREILLCERLRPCAYLLLPLTPHPLNASSRTPSHTNTPPILSVVSLHLLRCCQGLPVIPPPAPRNHRQTNGAWSHSAAFTPTCQRDSESSRQPCNENIKSPPPATPSPTQLCTRDHHTKLSLMHMLLSELHAHIC